MTIGETCYNALKHLLADTEESASESPVDAVVEADEQNLLPAATDTESCDTDEQPYSPYHNNTYDIVSRMAYLLGISKNIFENVHEARKAERGPFRPYHP